MATRPSQHPLAVALRVTPQRRAAANAAAMYQARRGADALHAVQTTHFEELQRIYDAYDSGELSLEEAVSRATAAFNRFIEWFSSH